MEKVRSELRQYVEEKILPQYELNDGGHNIVHVREVIRRARELNEWCRLGLEPEMVYAIAAYHDLGKYIDHERHEKIAAEKFAADEEMKKWFSDEQRKVIKEAIEDHRSSMRSGPRSIYGKLISSADRNTNVEIVFRRSFLVGKERQPETPMEEYLDFTLRRLREKYGDENPERMYLRDFVYQDFLREMRELLQDEEEFKRRYCEVNGIADRKGLVGAVGIEPTTKRL